MFRNDSFNVSCRNYSSRNTAFPIREREMKKLGEYSPKR